ncbi:MAG: hypothetical protein RRY78_06800 [Clostridia bacterium]
MDSLKTNYKKGKGFFAVRKNKKNFNNNISTIKKNIASLTKDIASPILKNKMQEAYTSATNSKFNKDFSGEELKIIDQNLSKDFETTQNAIINKKQDDLIIAATDLIQHIRDRGYGKTNANYNAEDIERSSDIYTSLERQYREKAISSERAVNAKFEEIKRKESTGLFTKVALEGEKAQLTILDHKNKALITALNKITENLTRLAAIKDITDMTAVRKLEASITVAFVNAEKIAAEYMAINEEMTERENMADDSINEVDASMASSDVKAKGKQSVYDRMNQERQNEKIKKVMDDDENPSKTIYDRTKSSIYNNKVDEDNKN